MDRQADADNLAARGIPATVAVDGLERTGLTFMRS